MEAQSEARGSGIAGEVSGVTRGLALSTSMARNVRWESEMDLKGVELEDLRARPAGARWPRVAVGAALLLGLAGAAYLLWSTRDQELAPTPPQEQLRPLSPTPPMVEEPAEAETVAEPAAGESVASSTGASASGVPSAASPEIELPALEESDPLLRSLAGRSSTHPKLPGWLVTPGLVRRFVVVVDNIAEGASPRRQLSFLAPEAAFEISRRTEGEGRERLLVDAGSYERYNLIADVIASLDAKNVAEVYRTVKPLIEEAYRELGVPEESFDERLSKAFEVLLATPIVEGEIELYPLVVTYAYADPELEDLAPVQKHLLRMGPRNVALVQEKLREMATELARVYFR